jgi:ADP-heptose:LPS heptosyltransferase/glycosyltransferase involved in cell wall biosynthesis
MSTVSVVILTANRRVLLEQCLRHLAAGTRLPDEVVVVNNGSTDDTAEFLAAARLPCPLRVIDGPGGSFAEARNAGVRAATHQAVAFIDDDCEADRFWLARLVEALDANGWEAAGGMVFAADEVNVPSGYTPELAWATGCTTPGLFGPLAGRLHLPSTSNLVATRALLAAIPFAAVGEGENADGTWSYLAGREDASWWRAVRRAGKRVGIVARAIVWHHVPKERFELAVLRERIRNDGRAHWLRERPRGELRGAARDIVNAPFAAIRDTFKKEYPAAQAWEQHLGWARRQLAFLDEAIEDRVPPTERSAAFVAESARLVASGAKAAARQIVATAFDGFRTLRPIPTREEPPRRLLVVLHDFLGDAVLALPMLGQLHEAMPDTEITILTGPVCQPLLKATLPARFDILAVSDAARGRSPAAAARLYKELAPLAPDAVLVAYCHGLAPGPLFFLDHAPVIAWREDNGFGQRLWGDLVAAPVRKSFQKPEPAALLDLLAPMKIRTRLERPRVSPGIGAGRRDGVLAEAGVGPGGYAVVHFETGDRGKFWPPDRMAAVVRDLLGRALPVFLVGSREGHIEAERQGLLTEENCFSLGGLLDSAELAGMLEGARVFLGCDSGPGHLAQAVRTPSLLLFGMTEPRRWGPMPRLEGEESLPLQVVAAAPGDWLVEELVSLPANVGMALLTVERVLGELGELLAATEKATERGESH